MLEILITSSSRPQLFPYFWESFKKMAIIRQPYRVTVHEDQVFPEQSKKVLEYLNELKEKGEIHIIDQDNPAKGLGWTLDHYITKRFNTKYVFYLQEDWEFERPIDIDRIIWTMDQNPNKLNLVFFNKIKNNGVINKCEQREYNYRGMKLCIYHGWAFLPGIWRLPFVKKHWVYSGMKPEGAFTNSFGSHETRKSVRFCEENIGAYIYGPMGDWRYVRHLGNDFRCAKWRLEKHGDKLDYGGNHSSAMDIPYMSPWLKYKKRPTRRGDISKK